MLMYLCLVLITCNNQIGMFPFLLTFFCYIISKVYLVNETALLLVFYLEHIVFNKIKAGERGGGGY